MAEQRDLSGIVEFGRGLGAGRRWTASRWRSCSRFPVSRLCPAPSTCACPGRLNEDPAGATCLLWRSRLIGGREPAETGYFLVPVTVAGRYRGLAFQAVEPGSAVSARPGRAVLEAHLHVELGLDDGDLIAVWLNNS